MCAIDDGERYLIWKTGERRAAKPHKCGECYREIAKGERYLYSAGLYDGRWTSNHICAHCEVACEWLRVNCGGYLDHGVYEDFHEHAAEYPALAWPILRVCVGMRRKWVGMCSAGLMALPKLPPSIRSVVHPVGKPFMGGASQ